MQRKELHAFFLQITGQHKALFYKIARTYCNDPVEREDLIQEILLQVWKALPGYDPQYSITTLLYRIALNVAISNYRKTLVKQKRLLAMPEKAITVAAEEPDEKDEQLSQLFRFIEQLKPIDRALMLLYLEEKTYREIADITGITETNVATRISRIKQTLKQRFANMKTD